MEIKTVSARSLPQVTNHEGDLKSESFLRMPKVDPDKLAAKLQNRPKASLAARLLLVAAKAQKRQSVRSVAPTASALPPTASDDAKALDPVG